MKLALIGNTGATNIGDEAILTAILKSHPQHHFIVFSADPKETAKRHGVLSVPLFPCGLRSFLKYGFRESKQALIQCEVAILGGGGLMQDDKPYACLIWAWQVFFVKHYKKPLFIYATGVGPLRTWIGKILTRYVYSYASAITVRDAASADLLKKLGIDPQKITVTADPAFLMEVPKAQERTKNLFIINLRPWHNPGILDTMTTFLKWLEENHQARFRFVVMQQIRERDNELMEKLANHFNEQIFCPKDFVELLRLMSECEAAIGMRYHFAIAAFLTHTPILSISYSPKVTSLFKALPEQVIDLSNLSLERLKGSFVHFKKSEQTEVRKKIVNEIKERARENQRGLEEFLSVDIEV